MEKIQRKNPFAKQKGTRKESYLLDRTKIIIDLMMSLKHFHIDMLTTDDIPRRRIGDIVPILLGAGFLLPSNKQKKHYMVVGIEGVRILFDSFKRDEQPHQYMKTYKLTQSYAWNMVRLLATKDVWDEAELRSAVCPGEPRRAYDIIGVFRGAGLIEKTKESKKLRQTIFPLRPRMILKVSDEDAISLMPELEQYLKNNQINDELVF